MAVLFISHSSEDDRLASALEQWLRAHGFTSIFIDHQSIAGGDKWAEALKKSAGACRVVIFVVTANWLASPECFGEFKAAWYMGKRLIPLFMVPPDAQLDAESNERLQHVYGEDQGLDLLACLNEDGSLDIDLAAGVATRLKDGLNAAGANTQIGLDPEAFEIDKQLRPSPFPGLSAFDDDDADAAVFYGRSQEIADVLDVLRGMRARGERQPLVILGQSGSGKSSLLKAGLIPRLRRETSTWLPLRAFRVGSDPLYSFADAIARTGADFKLSDAPGEIHARLLEVWRKNAECSERAGPEPLITALEAGRQRLVTAAARPEASILISVDQAEELGSAEGESASALADYLDAAHCAQEPHWRLAFTTRTDSFPAFQASPCFRSLKSRGYDLRALPAFNFKDVVFEPASRYGVAIEPALVEALVTDAPKDDALPLLAFILQRLWDRFGNTGKITKANYDALGGLSAILDDAAERALQGLTPDQDVPLSANGPSQQLKELGASTFVPALVNINAQSRPVRCVAAWSSFTEPQQELLSQFVRWRLCVRKDALTEAQDACREGTVAVTNGQLAGGGTVEVAHEALFREWGRLRGWLEPERQRLESLRTLRDAARCWNRFDRDTGYLTHSGDRLAAAEAFLEMPRFDRRLLDSERDYINACRKLETAGHRKAWRAQAAIYMLLLAIVAGLATSMYQRQLYALKLRLVDFQAHRVAAQDALKGPKGKPFWDCTKTDTNYSAYCPGMVVVPAGVLRMGTPAFEFDGNEGPQHKVTISKAYAVSIREVTIDQWDQCVASGGCKTVASDSGWGRKRRPAINVNWYDAQQYVSWLSGMTGQPYRLLSEAEWEYAARAGSVTDYSWGQDIGKGNANCDGCDSRWDTKHTVPVGSFKANTFGLYDMHGNVWEWTEDCWHDSYRDKPADLKKNGGAWTAGECQDRVIRGGSWRSIPYDLRSANRSWRPTDNQGNDLGFRVGRTLTP